MTAMTMTTGMTLMISLKNPVKLLSATDKKVRTPRRGFSVRARVLAGMLGLITLAFAVTGTVVYLLQVSSMDARIDDSLKRSVQEFQVLTDRSSQMATTVEPLTAEALLYAAMQQTLPAKNEGMLSLLNGSVRWTAPEIVKMRPENDPGFIDWAVHQAPTDRVMLQTVPTSQSIYRVVSIPLSLERDQSTPHLFFAYDYTAEKRALNQGFMMYLLVGLVILLGAGAVGWLLVGRLLRPVTLLRDTARQISESDLSQRIEVVGRDDLAELTITVNAMLDRVQNAMMSKRQLLDDVGHELRTPVTVIQGHLELMDVNDPHDVGQAREIAMAELDRMSFLINDLVTLATSNSDGFVQLAPTNVGTLLDDLLDKARTLGQRNWRIGNRVEATADLDAQRITQAMLQLCSNAVKFSAVGSTITFGTNIATEQHNGSVLRFWVRDEGIGIDASDQDRIFERFGRGQNSKRTEGSGLGLNIVSAIAEAHRGTVGVSSDVGIGSTFVIEIPTTPQKEEDEPNTDH
ncbi:sensor histidine kinase [Paeniglutamicibacter terrestris]|nr:HAMP domain-containing sensor histidine kinase [Paeniglutamicibacter terrestris]